MKLSFLILATSFSLVSFAQEINENALVSEGKRVKGIHVELKALRSPEGKSLTGSNYEVSLGYVLKDTWQIQYTQGRLNKSKTTSGGDLKEWEYVEEGSNLESTYHMLELKKLFYNPHQTNGLIRGFFTSLGYGQIQAKINYDYNRYKPDNGLICFITCDNKAVEETDSATTKVNVPFYRASGGYSYELASPRNLGVVNISAAVNYTEYLNKDLYVLKGSKHQGSFDVKDLDKLTLNLGFGVMF